MKNQDKLRIWLFFTEIKRYGIYLIPLFAFMGRIDPVECIGVSQQRNENVRNIKPPAMRVRGD